jgi:hypothetical protein
MNMSAIDFAKSDSGQIRKDGAAHRNDRSGMTTGRWWRCSRSIGSIRVGAQRLDKACLGRR